MHPLADTPKRCLANRCGRIRSVVLRLQRATPTMQTLIISSNVRGCVAQATTTIVGTPLDAIKSLERLSSIGRVVLGGSYADNDDLAIFISEFYPSVRLDREV
jgi:hypothetical protein